MTYSFRIENEALKELDDILAYIAVELKNPDAAKKLFKDIKENIELLKENPHCMAYSNVEALARAGVRQMPINNFSLLYIVDDDLRKFTILHIKYSRSDMSKLTV